VQHWKSEVVVDVHHVLVGSNSNIVHDYVVHILMHRHIPNTFFFSKSHHSCAKG
jgi:hypothetical protein